MAVSGKTAAPIKAPYFVSEDDPPDMAEVTEAMADRAHTLFADEFDAYRELVSAIGSVGGAPVGTYFLNNFGSYIAEGSVGEFWPAGLIEIRKADLARTDLATKIRLKMQIAHGDPAPGAAAITAGLYPITAPAGNTWKLGGVSAAVVASVIIGKDQISQQVGADVALPADGIYALGFKVTNAAVAANTVVKVQAQIHWV